LGCSGEHEALIGAAVAAAERDDLAVSLDGNRVGLAGDDAGAQFLWRSLRAKALARRGELEEAEMLGREAVALASKTDALTQHGNVLLGYADVLRLQGRAADASAATTEALGLFQKKKNAAAIRKARSLAAAKV
jgi:tetratricopeptide (TPR) repeat protein